MTAPQIHISTRKGLFIWERSKNGWAIARTAFLGDPVSISHYDRANQHLYAALNLGHFGVKLHRSKDFGRTWTEVAVPKFEAAGDDPKAPTLKMIWALESSGDGRGLWAGTIPGALFYSGDHGASWEINRALWNDPARSKWVGGGYDESGLHSICVHPQDPKKLLLAISTGGVWKSHDAGKSWTLSSNGLRAAYLPPDQAYDPIMQDAHRMVQSPCNPQVLWIQHHNGIFVSRNEALRWDEIKDVQPSVFGFAAATHPTDENTAWFIPAVKDEHRLPKDAKLVVTRTTNGGRSFERLSKGLPHSHAYDLVYRHALDVDPSGNGLCFGSTTGNLWYSDDQGEAWQTLSHHLPPIYAIRFA